MKVDELIEAITEAKKPHSGLDLHVMRTLLGPDRLRWRFLLTAGEHGIEPSGAYWSVTRSIDAARSLLSAAMPGWIYRLAECSVSDDAWVLPDFNDPKHGAEFQRLFPLECQRDPLEWFGSDIDLRPPGRPAAALCIAMLTAHKKAQEWLTEKEMAVRTVQ